MKMHCCWLERISSYMPENDFTDVGCYLNTDADDAIMRSCTPAPTTVSIERSSVVYIASANYPNRYPIDSDCQWNIVAEQPELLSTVRLTIIDFELDVRRGGRCHDVLRVVASSRDHAADTHQCA